MTIMAKGVVRLRLSEIMEENDWKQIELSRRTGLSANGVSVLLRGSQIRYTTLAALVEATGKPISEILVYESGNGSESP